MLRIDRLIAGPEIGMGEKLQELVGARTADDVRGIEPVARGDRLAQVAGRAIGIEGKSLAAAAKASIALGLGAKWRLVRRQLEDRSPLAPLLPGT